MKKGISLVGIEKTETVRAILKQYPDCFFELSYLSTQTSLDEILPVISGHVASVHLLCPKREFFPNLACDSAYLWSEKEILRDAELAARTGAENLVLHPGYLVDGLLSTIYEKRLVTMQNANLIDFMIDPSDAVCTRDYIKSDRYRRAFDVMVRNARKLNGKIKDMGLHLCLENLNPRAGYLLIHPQEMKELASEGFNLCLDVGHMQVNAALFGFDTLSAIKDVLSTGAVKTMHLHSNDSCKGHYQDSHKSFDAFMPYYREIIKEAEKTDTNLILEVLEEPQRNVSLIF